MRQTRSEVPVDEHKRFHTRACWNMQHPSANLDQYAITTLNMFLEFPVEMILKAEVNDTHFRRAERIPRCIFGANLMILFPNNLLWRQAKFPRILRQNDLGGESQWVTMTSTNFLSASSCLLEHIDVQVCVDIYMNNACIVEIIWKEFRHIHYIMLWDPNDFFITKFPKINSEIIAQVLKFVLTLLCSCWHSVSEGGF